jgi:hypothetical protein
MIRGIFRFVKLINIKKLFCNAMEQRQRNKGSVSKCSLTNFFIRLNLSGAFLFPWQALNASSIILEASVSLRLSDFLLALIDSYNGTTATSFLTI